VGAQDGYDGVAGHALSLATNAPGGQKTPAGLGSGRSARGMRGKSRDDKGQLRTAERDRPIDRMTSLLSRAWLAQGRRKAPPPRGRQRRSLTKPGPRKIIPSCVRRRSPSFRKRDEVRLVWPQLLLHPMRSEGPLGARAGPLCHAIGRTDGPRLAEAIKMRR
jgi:hypothetical protein